MRGIALSDLHLGFRAYPRLLNGRNAREQDVEDAWQYAVDVIIRQQPDLVTIAGDVFHSVKPDFWAVKAFQDGIQRITRETQAMVVIIGGNHCMPRTVETITPSIVVSEERNVYVVTEPKRLLLHTDDESISVSCFPFTVLAPAESYSLAPDPFADVNVLLVHAAVREAEGGAALPYFYGGAGALDVGREASRWDVIACGDYHDFTRLDAYRLAFYSGSIERTSSNIWPEREKVVVLYDTNANSLQVLPIPTRLVITQTPALLVENDIGTDPIAHLNLALEELLAETDSQAIVRMVAQLPSDMRDQIDWKLVSRLKEKLFHFQLDVEWRAAERAVLGDRRERRSQTLQDDAIEYFAADDEAVRACAMKYLALEAA